MSETAAPPAVPPPAAPQPVAPPIAPPAVATPPPLAPYVSPGPAPAPALGAQPAVAWAAPTATVAEGSRTTLSAVAGVMLLVLGILGALFGLLFFAVAGMVGSLGGSGAFDEIPGMPPGMETAIGGFVAVIGAIIVIYSILYIIGGVGVLRSRGWGRVLGIVVGIISGLIWLASVFSPSTRAENAGGVIIAFVLLAIHLYIVIVLIGYWRNRAPA